MKKERPAEPRPCVRHARAMLPQEEANRGTINLGLRSGNIGDTVINTGNKKTFAIIGALLATHPSGCLARPLGTAASSSSSAATSSHQSPLKRRV